MGWGANEETRVGQAGGRFWGLDQSSESGTGTRLDKEPSEYYAAALSPSMGLLPAGGLGPRCGDRCWGLRPAGYSISCAFLGHQVR